MRRRLLVLVALLACAQALLAAPAQAASSIKFTRWTSTAGFATGTFASARAVADSVELAGTLQRVWYDDPYLAGGAKAYDSGTWTGPWKAIGFSATSLVPSWTARLPSGSWLRVEIRVRSGATVGSWDTVANWAAGGLHRVSGTGQTDDLAKLAVDTVLANSGRTFDAFQIRVRLARPAGTTAVPRLDSAGAVAANFRTRTATTSSKTVTANVELAVPRYSQMIHANEYTELDGGGEAWCSPTSTSMVMRYFGRGPTTAQLSGIPYADPWVDHAAKSTYDRYYEGTGNWPFNVAFASAWGLDGFVTRLLDLRDAEAFVKKGIPLPVSIAFGSGGLSGAPLTSTPGHLLVIVGFEADGDVIVNDPAAASNSSVRRVYNRAQFEKAWLGGSGGITYVMHPPGMARPTDTARW